jgi:hypothetical protein
METIKSAGLILGALALLSGVLVFIYVCLFKAKESNMPNVARGVGLCALAGVLKVLLLLLAEKVAPGLGAPWVNYPLVGMLVAGVLLMLSGFGEGPK